MEKETFRSAAFSVDVVAKEVAVTAAINGLTTLGTLTTMTIWGVVQKHPIIGCLLAGVSGAIATNTIVTNDAVQDAIIKSASYVSDRATEMVCGLNLIKETED